MQTKNDEIVLEYWRLPKEGYFHKLIQDNVLECDTDLKNTMPAHLGNSILSHSKRYMNVFMRKVNGFEANLVYYTDTDSLYTEKR